jgi:hypothetical protein
MIAEGASLKRWNEPFGAGSETTTSARARTRFRLLRWSANAGSWPRSRRQASRAS